MSYSLKSNCTLCTKKSECIDSAFIQGAISGIHSVNYSNGVTRQAHLGCGSIDITCYNFKDERVVEPTQEAINKL